jgi:hypothetical protein
VNLAPATSFQASYAWSASAGRQVGYGDGRAILWNGSADSAVDLTPDGAVNALAYGVAGNQQVGFAQFGNHAQACVWSGSASSWSSLHPANLTDSIAYATDGQQQAGQAEGSGGSRASLWSGSAASWVDLNPLGATESTAYGVSGGQQVGYARFADGVERAAHWTGSAQSWVNLHPSDAQSSRALAVHGGQQVGYVVIASANWLSHATLWNGSAASRIDLNAFLPQEFDSASAEGIWHDQSFTYIVGEGHNFTTGQTEALLWISPLPCYANCDGSAISPVLNANDFACFLLKFATADPYANCDGSTSDPILNANDFACFLNRFAAGCP